MHNHDIIYGFEQQFAREVALGSILTEPQPVWSTMIPGKFVFDFLKRLKRIRTFSARYLFVRDLAFSLIARQADIDEVVEDITTELTRIAKRHGPVSQDPPRLQAHLKTLVGLLNDHYRLMLAAEGNTWFQLMAAAYPDAAVYQKFCAQQEACEQNIAATVVFPKIERLRLPVWTDSEKNQLAQRRVKYTEMAFGG